MLLALCNVQAGGRDNIAFRRSADQRKGYSFANFENQGAMLGYKDDLRRLACWGTPTALLSRALSNAEPLQPRKGWPA